MLTVKSNARSNALHGCDMSHAGALDDGALTVSVMCSMVVTQAVQTVPDQSQAMFSLPTSMDSSCCFLEPHPHFPPPTFYLPPIQSLSGRFPPASLLSHDDTGS